MRRCKGPGSADPGRRGERQARSLGGPPELRLDRFSLPGMDKQTAAKVPAVTLVFWVLKIFATTLGETAGDTLSMTLQLGYLAATGIFAAIFAAAVAAQIAARRFHPWIYWATIVATTTVGTTLADFATRSLGIGYAGGSALLLTLLLASLAVWYRALGTVAVESVSTPA